MHVAYAATLYPQTVQYGIWINHSGGSTQWYGRHGFDNNRYLGTYSSAYGSVHDYNHGQLGVIYGNVVWLNTNSYIDLQFNFAKRVDNTHYTLFENLDAKSPYAYSVVNGSAQISREERTCPKYCGSSTLETSKKCNHLIIRNATEGTVIRASMRKTSDTPAMEIYFIIGSSSLNESSIKAKVMNVSGTTNINGISYSQGQSPRVEVKSGLDSSKFGTTFKVEKNSNPAYVPSANITTSSGKTYLNLTSGKVGTSKVQLGVYVKGCPYPVWPVTEITATVNDATPRITELKKSHGLTYTVKSAITNESVTAYGYELKDSRSAITWSNSSNGTIRFPKIGTYNVYARSNLGIVSDPVTVTTELDIESIEAYNPATEYNVGDAFKQEGGIFIKYEDNINDMVDLTEDKISGFDTSTPGTKTVTVTHEGHEATYDITVIDPNGNKAPYIVPEDCVYGLDVDAIKISAKDDDGSVVQYGYTPSIVGGEIPDVSTIQWQDSNEFDLKSGEYNFYAKDNEGAVSNLFKADRYRREDVKSLIFLKPDKVDYLIYQNIDPTGGKFTIRWLNNGVLNDDLTTASEFVLRDFPLEYSWIDAYDNKTVGTREIICRFPGVANAYGSFDATFSEGDPSKIVAIEVHDEKQDYLLNQEFVQQGNVHIIYGDGARRSTKLLESMLTDFDTSELGTKTVTVTHEGLSTTYDINVKDPNDHGAITGITVSGQTTEYPLDAPFDDKGTVTITYEDGTTSDTPLTSDMLSGFDTSAVGTVPITVTHDGHEANYDITVTDPDDHGDITGIVVSGTTPTYEKDDPFDGKGTVQVVYEDGTTVDIPLTEDMLSNFDTSTPGTITVTVTHEGHTDTFDIEVTEGGVTPDPDDHGAITGITVSGVTTEYDKDEPFDKLGTVVVEYEDGTTKDIPLTEDMLSGFDTSTPGTVTVTVTYAGNDTTYDIEVTEPIIEDKVIKTIKVVGLTKNYMVDEPFDNRGTIIIVYSDYSVEDVPVTEDMLTNFDTSSPGTVTVTLDYEDYTEDYVINVDEPFVPAGEIAEISVYDYVDEYMVHDDFIKQGTVAINYTDDTTDEVPLQKDMLTGFETSEVGNVNVLVTLGEATTDYDITVYDLDKEIVGIKVSDETTSYEVGDNFNGKGIITVYYDDGTSEELPLTEDMLEGFDTSVAGKVEVMVVYEDFADTYIMNVKAQQEPEPEPYITGITASGIQTTYTKGDNLNTTNGKVTIHWSDGTTTQVDITPDMVTGFDTNKVGTYPITVTHEGFTTDINITIKEPSNQGGNSGSGSGSGSGGSSSGGGGGSSHRPSKPSTSKPSTSKPDTTTTIDDTKTPLVDKPSIQAPGLDSEGNQFKLNTGIGLHSLGDKGYIAGYPDATFKPAQGITRAEFAAILYRVFTFDNTKTAKSFIDVKPEAWYYDAVQTLTANNIIYGYPNNEFKPNDRISVADALLMLGRLIDLSGYEDTTNNQYVANSTYSKEALARAINSGIVGNDVNVDTAKEITREQVVEFINNIIYDTLETSKPNRFVDINTSMETYKDIIKAAILK